MLWERLECTTPQLKTRIKRIRDGRSLWIYLGLP
jgi:hypothetical protein